MARYQGLLTYLLTYIHTYIQYPFLMKISHTEIVYNLKNMSETDACCIGLDSDSPHSVESEDLVIIPKICLLISDAEKVSRPISLRFLDCHIITNCVGFIL